MTQQSQTGKTWHGTDVRKAFLDFFEEMQHSPQPSSALVPGNDPTLLFTNAGMVQFKDVFLGLDHRDYSRATTSQKCMRVSGKHNDLENVGPSPRHHTFFEMLGNFSFGDYFKRDACRYAYDLITRVYGIPLERLFFTVHRDDEEAYRIWIDEIGVPPERVAKLGDSTNFWQMADTGPCGYTAEIHYDMFEGQPVPPMERLEIDLDENPDDRTLEIWNLVFMQFNQLPDGTREPLPATGVDTGMGLERITMVLQNATSTYDTDLFTPIMDRIQQITGQSDAERQANTTPYRVIADHTRAGTFMISDGVTPGNEGRNYVCRMIIRRAARFGSKIGLNEPFMGRVAEAVIEQYAGQYPELEQNREIILQTLTAEEERFATTVESGIANLQQHITAMQSAGETQLDGETAFKLYATYGLPLEITRDILQEGDLSVDDRGYHQAMEAHRIASGAGQAMGEMGGAETTLYRQLLEQLRQEGKLGPEGVLQNPYAEFEFESKLLALLVDGKPANSVKTGTKVEVVVGQTPYYTESGGQVADSGTIIQISSDYDDDTWEIRIDDVRKPLAGMVVHSGEVVAGRPTLGDKAMVMVDDERRWDIMRNHTGTHLLHTELRHVLGSHAQQRGSLVAPDRLRFDFSHPSAISDDDLAEIARRVNQDILTNYPVKVAHTTREKAIEGGAMALFGEKYGENVRTISIGEPVTFSYELCGGTHVFQTADIGPFVLLSESAVAAGIRRIEALTGRAAQQYIERQLNTLGDLQALLNATADNLTGKIENLLADHKSAQKTIAGLQTKLSRQNIGEVLQQASLVNDVHVLAAQVEVPDRNALRQMTDLIREKHPDGVAVLGSVIDGNVALIATVGKKLAKSGLRAGDLIKAIAPIVDGSGGGRPEMAQGGGKNPARLPEALAEIPRLVTEALDKS